MRIHSPPRLISLRLENLIPKTPGAQHDDAGNSHDEEHETPHEAQENLPVRKLFQVFIQRRFVIWVRRRRDDFAIVVFVSQDVFHAEKLRCVVFSAMLPITHFP